MSTFTKRLGAATLASVAALVVGVPALHAQPLMVPVIPGQLTPQYRISPALALNQWAYNQSLIGRSFAVPPPGGSGFVPNLAPLANRLALDYALSNPGGLYGPTVPNYYVPPAYMPPAPGMTSSLSTASPYGVSPGYTSTSPYSTSPGSTGAPYLPDPYYPNPYSSYVDPLSGYLRGAASVFNAQGRFMIDREQSRLLREQRRQAEVDTRRRVFEEWLYERANTPTLQDYREATQKQEQRRAMRDPPMTEIWSGTSLNNLLDVAKTAKTTGPSLPLSDDIVKRLNFSPGSNYSLGAVKSIKDGTPLNWPLVLQGAEYEGDQKTLNKLLPDALRNAATFGRVEAGPMQEMLASLERLSNRLAANAGEIPPSQYIPAKRFLNQLGEALRALQQNDVDKYFNKLKDVKTVGDLVKEMTAKGLRFAPAAPGDESAYLAVQAALAAYGSAVAQGTTGKE